MWSGLGITGEHPRTVENCHRVCLLIDSHRHLSFALVSYMVAELEAETSRCQRVQRSRRDIETAALWFRVCLKPREQELAVASLWAHLQGLAKEVIRMCRHHLRILRVSLVAAMLVPGAYKKCQAYDQVRRPPGELIGDYAAREQRAFRERLSVVSETPEKTGHTSAYSDAECEMVQDEDTFTEAPWRQEQTGETFFELQTRDNASLKTHALKRISLLRDNDFTAKVVWTVISEVEGRLPRRRRLHRKRRSCTTPCTTQEQHPVRQSARVRQCTEKSGHHHHEEGCGNDGKMRS